MPPSDPVMPFGEHEGERLSQIDVEYLDWLIGQDKWLHPDLRKEIEDHLETRPEWRSMDYGE